MITRRRFCASGLTTTAVVLGFSRCVAQQRLLAGTERYLVNLQNGMQLGPGLPKLVQTLSTSSPKLGGMSGEVQSSSIGMLDDGLRQTYFNNAPRTVANTVQSSAPPEELIELPAKAYASQESGEFSYRGVLQATGFDDFGRRLYTIDAHRGPKTILQAMTEITATYVSVQVVRDQKFPRWDMRLSPNSIPPLTLRNILHHELDLTRPGEWMRIVRFYMQGERYGEARAELEQAIKKFPELAENAPILVELNQRLADQALREIELRRRSGQHLFATKFLQSFPPGLMPIETELKIKDQMDELQRMLAQVSEIRTALTTSVQGLPESDKQAVQPIVDEILKEIRFDSLARLNDYQRLRGDDSLTAQQKVAFAIGGWLLGENAGLDNFAVAKSLVRVHAMVREYLSPAAEPRRVEILTELAKEEGSQPDLVAKILANMTPPMNAPEHQSEDPAGLFRLSVQVPAAAGGSVDYVIQVPPEYDPYRKYPCVLSLPGLGMSPEQQVDWWAGPQIPNSTFRQGHASRNGYIVVSPKWMIEQQGQYNYTEGEHARVLTCLRDAMRRFSIDTDRVFISGHFDGATAAWDIMLAHPDLWAGAMMISPSADKFIIQCADNAYLVPTYFVYGEFAAGFTQTLGQTLDKYITRSRFDCLAVEYKGRGREHFYEELPRMIQWMELSSHRRDRSPDEDVELQVLRPGDRFFYWLESPELNPDATINAFAFDPTKKSFVKFKVEKASNSLRISTIPSRKIWVWLSPDVIDMTSPVKIINKGKSTTLKSISPDLGVMLEDVRTRADRMAPFYAKIELP